MTGVVEPTPSSRSMKELVDIFNLKKTLQKPSSTTMRRILLGGTDLSPTSDLIIACRKNGR